MANIKRTVTVGAGGAVENALAGSQFEFLTRRALVQIWATVPSAAAGFVNAQIVYGPELQYETGPVPVEVGVGRGPTTDDVTLADDIGAPTDRLGVRLENGDSNAHAVTVLARVVPV